MMTLVDFVSEFNFKLERNENNTYNLIDEMDVFTRKEKYYNLETVGEVIESLEVLYDDYLIDDICAALKDEFGDVRDTYFDDLLVLCKKAVSSKVNERYIEILEYIVKCDQCATIAEAAGYFSAGDEVRWRDPGVGEFDNPLEAAARIWTIDEIRAEIYLISDGYSTAEVEVTELIKL